VESIELCERLKPQLQSARTILFFAPMPGEIDLWPLLEESVPAGKIVALPWFDPATQTYLARRVENPAGEIVTGKFGVREPASKLRGNSAGENLIWFSCRELRLI